MTNVKDEVYVCARLLKNFKVELKRVAIRQSDMLARWGDGGSRSGYLFGSF